MDAFCTIGYQWRAMKNSSGKCLHNPYVLFIHSVCFHFRHLAFRLIESARGRFAEFPLANS